MKIGIIGAGGFAREVYCSLLPHERKLAVFFVEDDYYAFGSDTLPLSQFNFHQYKAAVAIADPISRKRIVESLPSETIYFTHIHSSAQIHGDVEIGEGSIICAGSIITTNVKIGKHSHINLITTIGHDCVIGDYFTTAPGVQISGNVTIGDCVYFGTRSCIKQKLSVCDNSIIGMNAGVTRSITEAGTYIGTPATKFSRTHDGNNEIR